MKFKLAATMLIVSSSSLEGVKKSVSLFFIGLPLDREQVEKRSSPLEIIFIRSQDPHEHTLAVVLLVKSECLLWDLNDLLRLCLNTYGADRQFV